ncbi:MAG: rod shape-determining protein RodA [Candidatus Pacebacteria bacterium]|nr:rod shape-determining protein RodA [Candidatus Paceibacterota bacterium]
MREYIKTIVSIDWLMFFSALFVSLAGLVTMSSFVGQNPFFEKQILWIVISVIIFFVFSLFDFRFLRRTEVVVGLFLLSCLVLLLLFITGSIFQGAQSWFNFGFFTFQPSDPIKLVVVLLLAKYFTRRHVEIAHIKHIFISAAYVSIIFLLVFLQPDFGSAIIILGIWFGMVLVSGISKKHLFLVLGLGLLSMAILWTFVFHDYQKQRIITFISPLTDIQGAGYNAYQSTIAVGSGEFLGKGIGFGTQSKLSFLPEYHTDFIFAAFAEEWGFVGVIFLFLLYSLLFYRIVNLSFHGAGNFETLFGLGVAVLFASHFIIHVGMNVGLLPVTGTTIPFMSYGGSHLLTEFMAIGILSGMSRYKRTVHRDVLSKGDITLG